MNETNIKHGKLQFNGSWSQGRYSWIQGRKFQKQGQNLCHQGRNIEVRGALLGPPGAHYWGPQGLDFLTMLAPGAGPAK